MAARKKSENSIPLGRAWYVYADQYLKSELKVALEYKHPTPNNNSTVIEGLSQIGTMISNAQSAERRAQKIRSKMKVDLLSSLAKGSLLASGFLLLRDGASELQEIEPTFWDASEVDWQRNIAKDSLQEFHRIRVLVRCERSHQPSCATIDSMAGHTPAAPISIDSSPREIASVGGRPSEKDRIIEAIEILKTEDDEFGPWEYKKNTEKLRKIIINNCPNTDAYGRNFSNKAFEKHIRAYFKKNTIE